MRKVILVGIISLAFISSIPGSMLAADVSSRADTVTEKCQQNLGDSSYLEFIGKDKRRDSDQALINKGGFSINSLSRLVNERVSNQVIKISKESQGEALSFHDGAYCTTEKTVYFRFATRKNELCILDIQTKKLYPDMPTT